MPREWQIRGLGPIVISVPTLNPTDMLLTRVFNMRQVRDCPHPDNPATHVHVFEMGGGGRTRSCTSPCSLIFRSPSRARAASITSRSGRRTPTMMPGRSG